MKVVVNGRPRDVSNAATVADVVQELGRSLTQPGAAAAVNGEVVPRSQWTDTALAEGDRVEVLGAVQGG